MTSLQFRIFSHGLMIFVTNFISTRTNDQKRTFMWFILTFLFLLNPAPLAPHFLNIPTYEICNIRENQNRKPVSNKT